MKWDTFLVKITKTDPKKKCEQNNSGRLKRIPINYL